ncbi:M1 family metallopeptidase [Wukongibacter baidiensis]|uniref:M1 family metallopeptidase n=1 Tax=Wukongibacter baidiensis TaxID=1723361 RepID=UPI003D7FB921
MAKRIIKLILVISIFLLTFTVCSPKEKDKSEPLDEVKNDPKYVAVSKDVNQYNIDVEFSPDEKNIKGTQQVIYINNEGVEIDKVYFHLYPNAFRKKETAPFLFGDFINAYPNGFSAGYIDIEEVYVDGDKGKYSIGELDETIMEVSLPRKLKTGDQITIDMKYNIKLPRAAERFGYGDKTYNLGNWYPSIAVYDESGWNLDPYYAIGDPFYADVSNYKVNIKAPEDFVIASTGNTLSSSVVEGIRKWELEANSVRDFAWVASSSFEVVEKEVDGTLLKMYYLKDDGDNDQDIRNKALGFAEKSIKTFNKVFGEYPYREYSVVQTSFPSGMEYPGIVFIGSQYYDKGSIGFLEVVIVHETAHQWWYGIVGNDQIDEAWLDESFASYSEVIYMMENYGENKGEAYHESQNEDGYFRTVDSLKDKTVLKSLNNFKSWNDYGKLVYTKGAIFLDDIKDRYGKEKFYKILEIYYNRYKFKIATTEDFLAVCEEVTGKELDDYFDKWLKDKGDEKSTWK